MLIAWTLHARLVSRYGMAVLFFFFLLFPKVSRAPGFSRSQWSHTGDVSAYEPAILIRTRIGVPSELATIAVPSFWVLKNLGHLQVMFE